jgi:hypothetical protein
MYRSRSFTRGNKINSKMKSPIRILTTLSVPAGFPLKNRPSVFIPKKPTTKFSGKKTPERTVKA